tara:strand:+ start:67 stop:261 length:195 start_codon:yes stop_codon:yes gene_type:complete
MINNKEAQKQAEETYTGFLKWCKVSFYWIMAILVILAWCNFGADTETGSQYNGEVYAPKGLKDD